MRVRFLALALVPLFVAAQTPGEERTRIVKTMDDVSPHYGELSRRIWEFAETGYQETKSAALLKEELRKHGFHIDDNIGGIPTAFTATWGEGKPVVAILGEYDALPGLSQDTTPERKPLVAGAPGHGCGHNLLGVGAAFAAITVKDRLAAAGKPGTVKFFGTPAEEGGSGKVYMIRAGAFNGVDVAITWHPSGTNHAGLESSLANITGKFRFHGVASHAAAAPEIGRSALDALLLTNHAVEMLREHVPQETRLHYIITKGGSAPNIVPDFAEGYFYARHPHMTTLSGIWDRMLKCAQGGALATETRLEVELQSSVWDILPNDALTALLDKNLRAVGGVAYTSEEQAFAERLRTTMGSPALDLGSEQTIVPSSSVQPVSASTDVGDVSWLLPTAQFTTATYVPGTAGHTWQSAACAGMSIGRKGMLIAAKTLALSALDIFYDPSQVALARAAFAKRKGKQVYESRIPLDKKPPVNYRQ